MRFIKELYQPSSEEERKRQEDIRNIRRLDEFRRKFYADLRSRNDAFFTDLLDRWGENLRGRP